MQEGYTGFAQYTKQTRRLPEVFQFFWYSSAIELDVARPSLSTMLVINVECAVSVMPNTDVMVTDELSPYGHVAYMTIAVIVRKRGFSSMIARAPKKRRMDTANEVATAVVENKDVLDTIEAAGSLHLSLEMLAVIEN